MYLKCVTSGNIGGVVAQRLWWGSSVMPNGVVSWAMGPPVIDEVWMCALGVDL